MNYSTIEEILAGVDNATQLVSNKKYDDNSFTVSDVPGFVKYKGNVITSVYANGNSWIGFGSGSEHFKFNRRDAAMFNLWTEEGSYCGKYSFFRIRWSGYCKYNASGDPYLQTFDLVIFDTGDIMFYAVNIPTSYYDGTFAFDGSNYTPPTTESRYVTFYDNNDGTYTTKYEPINLIVAKRKYLVRDGEKLYTIVDEFLEEISGPVNAELFQTSGLDTVPGGEFLIPLENPEVLCWTDADDVPMLKATVQGSPHGEHSIISDDINVGHSSIFGIISVEVNASDGATFFLSFDGGLWLVYDSVSGTWIGSEIGMSPSELLNVTVNAWNSLIADGLQNMKLKAVIDGTDTVTQIKFNFNNEPPATE